MSKALDAMIAYKASFKEVLQRVEVNLPQELGSDFKRFILSNDISGDIPEFLFVGSLEDKARAISEHFPDYASSFPPNNSIEFKFVNELADILKVDIHPAVMGGVKELLTVSPEFYAILHPNYKSGDLIWDVSSNNPDILLHADVNFYRHENLLRGVEICPQLFNILPDAFFTDDIIEAGIRANPSAIYLLGDISDEHLKLALEIDWQSIEHMSMGQKTYEICLFAMNINAHAYIHIPEDHRRDEIEALWGARDKSVEYPRPTRNGHELGPVI